MIRRSIIRPHKREQFAKKAAEPVAAKARKSRACESASNGTPEIHVNGKVMVTDAGSALTCGVQQHNMDATAYNEFERRLGLYT